MADEKRIPLHRERLNLPDNEQVRKLNDQKRKHLIDDFRAVFTTPAGRRVLRYLMNISGYKKGKIGGNPQIGMSLAEGVLYNCSREQVFLEFKEHIPDNILKEAEFGIFDDLLE